MWYCWKNSHIDKQNRMSNPELAPKNLLVRSVVKILSDLSFLFPVLFFLTEIVYI